MADPAELKYVRWAQASPPWHCDQVTANHQVPRATKVRGTDITEYAAHKGVNAVMVFKRLLGSLGVGGPTIDTVINPEAAWPGGSLSGQVHLKGGNADFDIEHITLELVARVEAEHEHGESEGALSFGRFTVGGGFRLAEGRGGRRLRRVTPFLVTSTLL